MKLPSPPAHPGERARVRGLLPGKGGSSYPSAGGTGSEHGPGRIHSTEEGEAVGAHDAHEVLEVQYDGKPGRMLFIDNSYLVRRRRAGCARGAVLLIAFGNAAYWLALLSGKAEPLSVVVLLCFNCLLLGMGVGLGFLDWLFVRGAFVTVVDSVFFYNSGGRLVSLGFSREAPLVLKKTPSGKSWLLSGGPEPGKRLSIRFAAFPVLDDFLRLSLEDLGITDSLSLADVVKTESAK